MVSGAIPDTSTIPTSAMLSALPCSMKWTPKSALLSKGLSHAVTGITKTVSMSMLSLINVTQKLP